MELSEIRIQNLRNLTDVGMEPRERINVLLGPNGSGKTAFLEAVYLLGSARSFRTAQTEQLVQYGKGWVGVFGRSRSADGTRKVGIKREISGRTEAMIEGKAVRRSSELAKEVVVQVATPEMAEVIDGPPETRRRLLDWGVFQVEGGFEGKWRNYEKVRELRNAALRTRKKREIDVWTRQLVVAAEGIEAERRSYYEAVAAYTKEYLTQFGIEDQVELKFARGWGEGETFEEALGRGTARDVQLGYTHSGPHRADLRVEALGRLGRSVLSRGRKKLLVVALVLSQVRIVEERTGKRAIILLDDVAAELDDVSLGRVVEALGRTDAQVFLTAVDEKAMVTAAAAALFHVKHGTIASLL